ncbi:MAG: ROK family transcriptional regulator [Alphaproteobacteria bacterium]
MLSYTTEGLRHHNRALVLKRLREVGAATHGELSQSSGLASGTVSVILNEFVDEGVIVKQQGGATSGRGRPKVHFALVGELALAGLVRIASDEVEFSLIDFAGTLKDRFSLTRPRDGASPSDFVQLIRQGLNRLAERSEQHLTDFASVTLSTKGIVNSETKTLLWSASFGSQSVDFSKAFHDLGNRLRLIHETSLVSDALYQGPRTLACLSLGSTIGLGLTRQIDAEETEHSAPAFSHFCHDPKGPLCRCGSTGCIDAYASFYGILRTALGAPGNKVGSQTIPREEILRIADEARRGNRNFQIAFLAAGEAIGLGLSRLASVYGAMDVVVTGSGTEYFDLMEPVITKQLGENLLTRLGTEVTLTLKQDEPSLVYEALRSNTLSFIEEQLVATRRLNKVAAA